MSESQFLANVELSPVPDIGLGVRPKNCTYQLAIFQREPGILNSKRYIVSLDLWNELDVLNKAALVMHELIYRELIEFYPIHQTSESTRYLNGALNSLLFDRLSVKEYISLLQTLRFPRADLNGFTIRLSAGNNRSEWRPFKFQLLPNGEFAFALLEDRGVILPLNNKHLSCLTESVAVYFHPNGKPAEVDSYMRGYLNCAKNYIYSEDKTRIEVIDQKWRFDQNGVLIAMIGTVDFGSNSASLTLDGYSLVPQIIRSYDKTTKVELQFSSSGKLSKLTIHEPSTLCRTKNSKEITFVLTPFAGFVQLRPETFRETLAKIPDCEYK